MGCYTRMLRKALDVSWKDHIANKELNGDLTTRISNKRRLQFHCKRNEGKIVSELVTWTPRAEDQPDDQPKLLWTCFIKTPASPRGLHHPWGWDMHAGQQEIVESHWSPSEDSGVSEWEWVMVLGVCFLRNVNIMEKHTLTHDTPTTPTYPLSDGRLNLKTSEVLICAWSTVICVAV